MMLRVPIILCLYLLGVSSDSINSFHKGPTVKPDIPYEDSPVLKPRKPPTHISEFTDPNTGLNPFLDLQEGPTSAGRNVMKDERKEDPPFLDFELAEGDGNGRRWGMEMPKQPPLEESIHRWPPFEETTQRDPSTTNYYYTSETIPSTTPAPFLKSFENEKSSKDIQDQQDVQEEKIEKEGRTPISKDALVYASATVVVAVLVLIFGVCWWRRKLKRTSQPHIAAENGELKR